MSDRQKNPIGGRGGIALAVFVLMAACLVSGCAGVHGWLSKAGDGPVTGGARVSVPLGGK